MEIKSLKEIVKEIKQNKKTFSITPRFLFNQLGFERRTSKNCFSVDKYLDENSLEVNPHYNEVWIDHNITLKHKDIAKRKTPKDPIIRLKTLQAAAKKPICIQRESKLDEAITIMQIHKYSQLPVLSGPKKICGYISWTTIGIALTQGIKSDTVKDYINEDVRTLSPETPILSAIKEIYEHDFVIVVDKSKELLGIITTTDISSQFLKMEEPFLLLEQIENQIRQLIDGKFLLEKIREACKKPSQNIESIEDLAFGDYIRLIEIPKNWAALNLKYVDKTIFINKIDDIRKIRNDIMHFEPAGITTTQHEKLKEMSDYLTSLLIHNQDSSSSMASGSASGENRGM